MKPTAVMIFAAGFGTRMRPLTNDRPKPMVSVGGRPMIDYALMHARTAGARKIVSNVHYLHDVIEPYLVARNITVIRELPDILDTGGGLRNAIPALGPEPVWTLNPDAIWQGPNPLTFAADHWDPKTMDAMLVCVPPSHALGTKSSGDFTVAPSGQVSRGSGAIYAGAQIVKTERLSEIPEDVFSLNMLWDRMIAAKRCYACLYPGSWCDVGHPDGIPLAETLLKDPLND